MYNFQVTVESCKVLTFKDTKSLKVMMILSINIYYLIIIY